MMCPTLISAKSRQKVCSITRNGIGVPQNYVEQFKWKQGEDKVEVGIIQETNTILISKKTQSNDAFLVAWANKKQRTGAKIGCIGLLRNQIQAMVSLPKRVTPIIFEHKHWHFALLLDEIKWEYKEFNKAETDSLKKDFMGTYQLLGSKDSILRVGEGMVKSRIKEHLKDYIRLSKVLRFRFIHISEKEDAELLEKILIEQYKEEVGILPMYNDIHK